MTTQQALHREGYSDAETLDITWSHVNTSWTHGPKTKPLDPGTLVRFKYTNAVAVIESSDSDDRLHPTRQATISVAGEVVGVMGQIEPGVAEECSLSAETVVAEIDLEKLAANADSDVHLQAFSKNPAIQRDIAIVIEKSVSYS